ncbi:MAG TPA: ribokinase [Acidimicrobiia bacterium]|nr:ribokinase [Acidimicrobiia bacterium]
MDIDIVVIGSVNHDVTVVTPRLPTPGETVLGTGHYAGGGGKGANQAVAAARLGAKVAMVGRVGTDESGTSLLDALVTEGIDVSGIGIDPEEPTGLAVITVDADAENTIVVSPGANMALRPEHLDGALIASAAVVLAQLEVPAETVTAAARACSGTFILNPAPARTLPDDLLERVDVLVPNRVELASLLGSGRPGRVDEVADLARRLGHRGVTVVTMGAAGAVVVDGEHMVEVPAPTVEAVDPTGAGDAFCGALAHGLTRGMELVDAVELAVTAGALAVTRAGAQTAMPTGAEVNAALRH